MSTRKPSQLEYLKILETKRDELDEEISTLRSDIQATCPHPDFATSKTETRHHSGDEWSRNEMSWTEVTYHCSLCGLSWNPIANVR